MPYKATDWDLFKIASMPVNKLTALVAEQHNYDALWLRCPPKQRQTEQPRRVVEFYPELFGYVRELIRLTALLQALEPAVLELARSVAHKPKQFRASRIKDIMCAVQVMRNDNMDETDIVFLETYANKLNRRGELHRLIRVEQRRLGDKQIRTRHIRNVANGGANAVQKQTTSLQERVRAAEEARRTHRSYGTATCTA